MKYKYDIQYDEKQQRHEVIRRGRRGKAVYMSPSLEECAAYIERARYKDEREEKRKEAKKTD